MKSYPSLLRAISVAAALVAAVPAALAQDEEPLTWYVVEIIVFERTSETGRSAEAWPADPGLPALADALELSVEGVPLASLEPGAEARDAEGSAAEGSGAAETTLPTTDGVMPRAFQLVPAEEFRLTDAWKSLEKSSAHRPLLQVAWIQPGLPAEKARLVHVRNPNGALGAVALTPDAGDDASLTPADGGGAMLGARVDMARDPSRVALDGTLRVHRARYLHVQADLLYYRPLESDGPAPVPPGDDPNALPSADSPDTAFIEHLLAEEDTAPRVFRLTESRRMRSRELHYLDHPLFGVLVEAWPLDLPDPPPADAQEAPEGEAVETPAPSAPSATEG